MSPSFWCRQTTNQPNKHIRLPRQQPDKHGKKKSENRHKKKRMRFAPPESVGDCANHRQNIRPRHVDGSHIAFRPLLHSPLCPPHPSLHRSLAGHLWRRQIPRRLFHTRNRHKPSSRQDRLGRTFRSRSRRRAPALRVRQSHRRRQ